MTIEAAERCSIPVSLCGEMGGDIVYIPLLVGMGLTDLSVSPKVIPEVKKIIRSVTYEESRELAEKVFGMETTAEILRVLQDKVKEILPEAV